MDEVLTWLTPKNFSSTVGVVIFTTMIKLHTKHQPIDVLTILEQWEDADGQPVLLSASLITSLTENLPRDLNIEAACMDILEASPSISALADNVAPARIKPPLEQLVDDILQLPSGYWGRHSRDCAAISFSADFTRNMMYETAQKTLELVEKRVYEWMNSCRAKHVVGAELAIAGAEEVRKILREIR
jgi:hypothetical protein